MPSTRGCPGTRRDVLCGESNLFGHLALQGPGNRRLERAPSGVAPPPQEAHQSCASARFPPPLRMCH
eukprot:4251412-Pyramimonas_sp.AAC.1